MNRLGMADKIKAAEERGEFNQLTQVRLVSPKGHAVDAPLKLGEDGAKSYVAPRTYLDALIQEQAVESGADFQQAQAQEPIFENGMVVGVRAKIGSNGNTNNVEINRKLLSVPMVSLPLLPARYAQKRTTRRRTSCGRSPRLHRRY